MGTGTVQVPVPGIFHFSWWYRNRYRKNLVPDKSLGTGIGEIWYRKKSRNRYRKKLVPKKVPVSVSKIFGTGKKYRYRYRLTFRVPSHTGDHADDAEDDDDDMMMMVMKALVRI